MVTAWAMTRQRIRRFDQRALDSPPRAITTKPAMRMPRVANMDKPSNRKTSRAIEGQSSDSTCHPLGAPAGAEAPTETPAEPPADDNSVKGRSPPAGAEGVLFIVGTPIGNLGDLTPRGRAALSSADAIAAEDTRRTRKLLVAEGVSVPRQFFSYRAENEARAGHKILALLQAGQRVALVSDAGMPAISDPGAVAVRLAVAAGHRVEVIPGVSAVTTAVALSGFAGKGFVFVGFAPQRKARIARALAAHKDFAGAIVLFESPRRLGRTLEVAVETLGHERSALVAFEMTKLYERVWRGNLGTLAKQAEEAKANQQDKKLLLGEATLVIAPAAESAEESAD